jgi:hypothetical protein
MMVNLVPGDFAKEGLIKPSETIAKARGQIRNLSSDHQRRGQDTKLLKRRDEVDEALEADPLLYPIRMKQRRWTYNGSEYSSWLGSILSWTARPLHSEN